MNKNSSDNPVVALGTFDGVHRGHNAMLTLAKDAASKDDKRVVVATFDPHPRSVVAGGAPPLLCSIDERIRRIREAGADDVVVVPFTEALSKLTPDEFVNEWIIKNLRASAVVVGHNFRFGHRASGDVEVLRNLCAKHEIEVIVCDLLVDGDDPVSSSRIRRLLAGGDVDNAARLLGKAYEIEAIVEHGARRGRELGMPTANLGVAPMKLVPLDGVYAGVAIHPDGSKWPAATSIGTNPQFTADQSSPPRTVEVHLIGYTGDDFYGESLYVDFRHHIRGQKTFDSVEKLVEQMQKDVSEAVDKINI